MDNTKLLQDITYYSRIIRERTKQKEKYKYAQNNPPYSQRSHWNSILPITKTKYNCYKYINTHINSKKLISPPKTKIDPQSILIPKQNKVLINPHFKQQQSVNNSTQQKVHVNPNFNTNRVSNTVYVNRLTEIGNKILKEQNSRFTTQKLIKPTQTSHVQTHPKLVKPPILQTKLTKPPIFLNDLKLIKQPQTEQSNQILPKQAPIIKQTLKLSPECFKSKYKLDRRRINSTTRKRKYSFTTTIKSRLKNTRSRVTINRNTNLVNISGNLYKISRNKLQKTNSNNSSVKLIKKKRNRYRYVKQTEVKKSPSIVAPTTPSIVLKRKKLMKPILGAIKIKRAVKGRISTKYKLINTNSRNNTKLKNKKLIRTSPNKYRKNNVPCPIFNRYGKCSSHDKGTCRRVHDPKLIAICKKYLQGACDMKTCTLSHSITLEKMPTCKFYLDGFCSKDQCPYLHVKLNEKTDICKDFLNGYCQAADKCDKRHVNYCPEFERTGKCSKIKCPYPHITTNEQTKQIKFDTNCKKESKITKHKIDESLEFEIDVTVTSTPVACTDNKMFRYYIKEDDVTANVDKSTDGNSQKDDDLARNAHKERTVTIETPDFIPFN